MENRDELQGQGLHARWLREPVLIFVMIAGGIFAWDALQAGGSGTLEVDESNMVGSEVDLHTIHVRDGIRKSLVEEFTWLEGREPDPEEEAALVENWLRDEIIFRTALIQGMHLNDGKMREHLIEKIRLLWAGVAPEPEESELLDYYADNMERYYAEPRMSFQHVFFREAPDNPEEILSSLRAGKKVEGDENFWLGSTMNHYARSVIKSTFGGEFHDRLKSVSLGQWIGPLSSPRGYHYVRVTERQPAKPMAYQTIRERIKNDWEVNRLTSRIDRRTDDMRESFIIIREGESE